MVTDASPAAAKREIARRFNRAAPTYDRHAEIQRRTLDLLVKRLAHLAIELPTAAGRILELGCGTGACTEQLLRLFPHSRLLSLDFAPAMLERARSRIAGGGPAAAGRVDFLCCDAEDFLAAGRERFALVTANATLQWFADPAAALRRIGAALAPGGILLTTIFGRESLADLDQGLALVSGGRLRVASRNFPDGEQLRAMLAAHFARVELTTHRFTLPFSDLADLLRHFRFTGTGGTGGGGAAGGFGRRHFRELEAWFQGQPAGGPVAEFEVFLVYAAAPPPRRPGNRSPGVPNDRFNGT